MHCQIRKITRHALFLALALLLPAATAQAGISDVTTTNSSTADDSTSGVYSGAGRASTLTTLTDDGSILQTAYKFSTGGWNDSYGTSDASLTSAYTIEFTVVAPGDYTLQIDQSLDATIETQGVSAYGTAEISLGGFSGEQTGGTLDSGTLNPSLVNYLETTGYLEGSPVDIAITETQSAVISGTSNGTPVQHTVTFSWDSSCDSTAYSFAYQGGDYCGVRGGISSNYGNYVTDYSTDSGTAADDGHLVTIIVTELAGPDLCAGVTCSNGDQCNSNGTCNPSDGTCTASSPVVDGTGCDDANGSTTSDQCTAGTCAGVDLCGNGTTDPDEECDDGNNIDGDGCTALCGTEADVCGEGNIGSGEECDDSNTEDGDGCSSRCQAEVEQSKDQQKCIVSQAGYLGRIAKGQATENAICAKTSGKGQLEGSVADCVANDAKGKIAKLQTKFQEHQTDVDKGKCLTTPDFAYVSAADVVASVKAEQIDFFDEVLGDAENTIIDATDKANKAAATCQAILMKVSDKLVQTRLKEFGTCVKKGLKAKEPAERIVSAVTAEKSCWPEAGPSGAAKIQKAVDKHADLNVKKCVQKGADYENVLDGRCNGASNETDLAGCIDEITKCTACLMINDTFDFNLDCDARDNDLIDGSCGGGGSPAGSFVDGPLLY